MHVSPEMSEQRREYKMTVPRRVRDWKKFPETEETS